MNILLVEHDKREIEKFKGFCKDIAIEVLSDLTNCVQSVREEREKALKERNNKKKQDKEADAKRFISACRRAGVDVDEQSIGVTLLQVVDCSAGIRKWNRELYGGLYFPLEVDKPAQKYCLIYSGKVDTAGWVTEEVNNKVWIWPWPHLTTKNFEFAPHLTLLDRLFPESVEDRDVERRRTNKVAAASGIDTETDKVWTKFSAAFEYVSYPSDVLWTLTQGDMRCFVYGFNASKPWRNEGDLNMAKIIGRCVANRILSESYPGSQEMYDIFSKELNPAVCIEYPDGTKIKWETGGTRYTWKYIPASNIPEDRCVNVVESLDASKEWYPKFLVGELLVVPKYILFDEQSGSLYHPWKVLQLLVTNFCEALQQNKYPELRSLYVALRQFATIEHARYIKGYVEAFPKTREIAASASKLSSNYFDLFAQKSLADIYKMYEKNG